MICEKCERDVLGSELFWREVRRQTMSSPAEYDNVGCVHCKGVEYDEAYDEAYERAAAKYDGEGKDWR